ncbi:unnamed protein product [Rotaria socialis]|uniref:Ribosomal protein L11 n=1 Tax=Rotaria socialis TaxID=392032 RepID=A0A820E484_9BILA|nr:unnamed protein product [Rotaria socialis]CAF4241184.1 unnamed protein product [Rotaria socialis]CAF4461894.1 unnamed protein product [Rotaria socialis]CAF4756906.1 unnamed protein product [Rotaria socialis]
MFGVMSDNLCLKSFAQLGENSKPMQTSFLGIKYDPSIGIYGMDFYVVLGRGGFDIGKRKHKKARIGASHRITKDEAIKWFQQTYEGVIMPGGKTKKSGGGGHHKRGKKK